MNPYNPYYFHTQNYMNTQSNRMNPIEQQYQPYQNPYIPNITNNQPMMNNNQVYLQGRMVESREVVTVIDAPLDGSVIYFPQTDGTAIYTKQLQRDGTSKTVVYKLVDDNNSTPQTKQEEFVSKEDINKIYSEIKTSLEEKINMLVKKIDELAISMPNKENLIIKPKGGK